MAAPNQNQGNSFFDPKTLFAIALVGIVWIGWQSYLHKKYPEAYKPKATEQSVATGVEKASEVPDEGKAASSADVGEPVLTTTSGSDAQFTETTVVHEDDIWKLELSSKGMGFKSAALKNFRDRQGQHISFLGQAGYLPFETNLVGRHSPLEFKITRDSDGVYVGLAQANGYQIQKKIILDSTHYSFNVEIAVSSISGDFSGLVQVMTMPLEKIDSSFLMPAVNQQEVFAAHGSTTSREYLQVDTAYRGAFAQTHLAALSGHYFSLAMINRAEILPELSAAVDPATKAAIAKLSYPVINRASEYNIKYTAFMGPKDLDILKKVDPQMTASVDFGWFSWLAIVLFDILRWLYSLVHNYGIAIILLTLLVRMVVLPFNLMSYRSMKAMQVIQPEIKALREKYKDDQAKLNSEMMAFMKEHKVNPLGGCLPMLLQFPIFIALYRVFGQSIDLYQAPFGWWIHDLSLKDPYYILPVVMGVVFFFQTKLTPSTMEPAQQKVMMFMPILFSFFMAGLPSALTLYMCVSTIFGFVQQTYVMRDRKVSASMTQAKA